MKPVAQLTGGSLFSGIGGLDKGLEQAGVCIQWQCESDEFSRRVLAKHWPDVPCYLDVKEIDHDTPKVDILFGGFPCQPVSTAGRRKVRDDPRWLWPEFARAIAVLRPRYVFVENVAGLRTAGMGFVLASLATLGYDAEWDGISAAAVGAPHLRERIFILAYTQHLGRKQATTATAQERPASRPEHSRQLLERLEGCSSDVADAAVGDGVSNGTNFGEQEQVGMGGCASAVRDADGRRRSQRHTAEREPLIFNPRGGGASDWWTVEPDVGRVAHGVPSRVDRLKGLGNAAVPAQVAFAYRLLMERVGDAPPITRPMSTVPLFE